MERSVALGCFCGLLALSQPITAQESLPAEKIRDISPDQKFAMRISYDADSNKQLIESGKADSAKIFSETIKSIELVTLPARDKVLELLPSDDGGTNYDNVTLLWSADSNWYAFYYNQPRVGYTSVYHRAGDKFTPVNKPDELVVDATKGLKDADVRNEYVQPLRWTKPGVLLLDQLSIFRGGEIDDAKLQLTAGLDPKTGKFQVVSKKKLPADVKRNNKTTNRTSTR